MEPFYHHNLTAGQLALHFLERDPANVVQVSYDDGVELTAREMAKLGLRVAKNIIKAELHPGNVVGIVAKNTTYLAPLILGNLLAGTPVSTLDPTFDCSEIVNIFQQTKPKLVFCDHDNWENVVEALRRCDNTSEVITVDEKMTGQY